MLAYLKVGSGVLPTGVTPAVQNDTYSLVPEKTLAVSDPAKGVIANNTAVYGVTVMAAPTSGTLTLSANGTFTYVPNSGTTTDSFTYCANGTVSGATCSSGLIATVQISPAAVEGAGGITVNPDAYASNIATKIEVKGPGVLANDSDGAGYPLTVDITSIAPTGGNASALQVVGGTDGSFTAMATAPGTYTFTYKAKNPQGTVSASAATVTLTFRLPRTWW